jgi:hypothetical protein
MANIIYSSVFYVSRECQMPIWIHPSNDYDYKIIVKIKLWDMRNNK